MSVERALRMIAGTVVLVSVALGTFVSPNWYWLTAFVGLNLFQSAFTNWCPMMAVLRKFGLRGGGSAGCCS
ncbi:MAG: DUF2892 domain-containing protein [Bryobacterales bacterium]|nr:DUF2892 domain-containing protein [Bryobacterales bacterium]